MQFNRPRGTRDVLPGESEQWEYLQAMQRRVAAEYGFSEIQPPMFEHTELFQRGVGDTTDVVEKEMYTFTDRDGRQLSLRPEGTAGVARAVIENNLLAGSLPIKLFYHTEVFRYERPQAGRYRQHTQFGIEVFGSSDPAVDAEVIMVAYDLFQRLGLRNLEVLINTVGCPRCRPAYREKLIAYYQSHEADLCPDCHSRLLRNPLRLLDCKQEACHRLAADAPKSADHLCPECTDHFAGLRRVLDALGVNYRVDPHIVRGLDYYTKTVFEIIAPDIGAQSTICGGGRYDGLIEEVGGPSTPGIGFGMGVERVLMALAKEGCYLPSPLRMDAYVVALGDDARTAALKLLYELRRAGVKADIDYMARSMKSQMKQAGKSGARYAVIIGGDELARGVATVRDLQAATQEELALADVATRLAALTREGSAKQ
jgi:histidyl-tRNA synthetase